MDKTQLIKESAAFVQTISEGITALETNLETYNKEVGLGNLGPNQVQEQFKAEKTALETATQQTAQRLYAELEQIKAQEFEQLKANYDTVTADNVAELSLLAELKLTDRDMQEMIDKYQNNPLALRRLENIAAEKGLYTVFPESKEDQLNAEFRKLDVILNSYKYFSANFSGGYAPSVKAMTAAMEADTLLAMLEPQNA